MGGTRHRIEILGLGMLILIMTAAILIWYGVANDPPVYTTATPVPVATRAQTALVATLALPGGQ